MKFFVFHRFPCSNILSSGYIQGMNDLLSPILVIMENEVDSFWCFVGLMNRMVKRQKKYFLLMLRKESFFTELKPVDFSL